MTYKQLVISRYKDFGFEPLLAQIRTPGRYPNKRGVNVLVNACLDTSYNDDKVFEELANAATSPLTFESILESGKQGISYGLNPYTDWALSQVPQRRDRWALILGLDYYSIGGLKPDEWRLIREDPFSVYDHFWFQLWKWIVGHFTPDSPNFGKFPGRRADGVLKLAASQWLAQAQGGILFHNVIPYLRPPTVISSGDKGKWEIKETEDSPRMDHCYEDIVRAVELLGGNVKVYCTRGKFRAELVERGLDPVSVIAWNAHPTAGQFVTYAKSHPFSFCF